MDKSTFLKRLEGMKAIGHLSIANLALLNTNSIDFNFSIDDGTTIKIPIKITDLLRQKQTFDINSFDKKIRYSFDLKPAIEILESADKEKVIQLFFGMALQIPIVRTFELIKSYSNETNQKIKFENQDWYNVAYAIRNCFSHDFKLEVYSKKLDELPFKWRNISITRDMLGKPISYSDIRIGSFAELLDAMVESGKDFD